MLGIERTLEVLAESENPQASNLLLTLAKSENEKERDVAIHCLSRRSDQRASENLLEIWDKLTKSQIDDIKVDTKRIESVLRAILSRPSKNWRQAVKASHDLNLVSLIPTLIEFAERTQHPHCEAVIETLRTLVTKHRDQVAFEDKFHRKLNPVAAKLLESIQRYPKHQNLQLIELYLVSVSNEDAELARIIRHQTVEAKLILEMIGKSDHPIAIEALASFLRIEDLPQTVLKLISNREDIAFRNQLLRIIGHAPTRGVALNLEKLDLPKCCLEKADTLLAIPSKHRKAFAIIHLTCNSQKGEVLDLLCELAESDSPQSRDVAGWGFKRCQLPTPDQLARTACSVPSEQWTDKAESLSTKTLERLIKQRRSDHSSIATGVQRVLGSLHCDALLANFQQRPPHEQNQLGQMVRRIDTNIEAVLRGALRHPVLSNRLDAIAMTGAAGLATHFHVELADILRNDNDQAKSLVAAVIGSDTMPKTLEILEDAEKTAEGSILVEIQSNLLKRQNGKSLGSFLIPPRFSSESEQQRIDH
ncbi:hypothetical protein OAA27_01595 [bacterium]|nr:hypothetical protein [bacterium]